MTRKELYAAIKANNLADDIKKEFGVNYTHVSNEDLEKVVNKATQKSCEPESTKKSKKDNCLVTAFFKLMATLQRNRVISDKDTQDIGSLL